MLEFGEIFQSILFAENKPAAQQESFPFFYIFLPLIFVYFYFIVLRPSKRERAKNEDMLKNLKKNDRIVTIGGIFGTVVNVNPESDEVTIKVDEGTNVRIRILRSAVSKLVSNETEGTSKKSN